MMSKKAQVEEQQNAKVNKWKTLKPIDIQPESESARCLTKSAKCRWCRSNEEHPLEQKRILHVIDWNVKLHADIM